MKFNETLECDVEVWSLGVLGWLLHLGCTGGDACILPVPSASRGSLGVGTGKVGVRQVPGGVSEGNKVVTIFSQGCTYSNTKGIMQSVRLHQSDVGWSHRPVGRND